MEELQKEIAREIKRSSGRLPRKRRRRWTLLFVGANGQVRKIGRFAGLALVTTGFAMAAAVVALGFFLVFHRPMAENRILKTALEQSRQENRRLKGEKDLLLADLVVAQEKAKGSVASVPGGGGESGPGPVSEQNNDPGPEDEKKAQPVPKPPSDKQPAEKPAPGSAASETQTPAKQAGTEANRPSVAVDNLVFTQDAQAQQLSVKFKIMNEGPESEPVSGRTFVVLETEDPATASSLTIPRVPLENGRPARVTSGRYFSIARFNTVTFKAKTPGPSHRFRRATVFVFALSGELLLQRQFSIQKKAP